MNSVAAIVLGLLIGWLVEWVIDWFYWRARIRSAVNEKRLLYERIRSLQEELNRRPQSTEIASLLDKEGNDNLRAIKGIGPVFAQRLHEASVHTFEHLSRLTPQEMEQILGKLYKRFFSKRNTILAQAKDFAERLAKHRSHGS